MAMIGGGATLVAINALLLSTPGAGLQSPLSALQRPVATPSALPSSQNPPPSDPQETRVDDVVVLGNRSLREAVDSFIDEVTEPPRGRGPARWHRRICVGAVNLQRDAAQVLVDRVSDVAGGMGLEVGEPGCKPNVVIVATDDASGLTRALVESRPNAFRPDYSGGARSQRALDSFTRSDRPVRWWHVSIPVDRDTGQAAVKLPGRGAPTISGGGLITSNITNRLLRTFVIVDITRVGDVSFQQLGDYVAMVALAQIDPEANLSGYQSVLNLFTESGGEQVLTDWDFAYLRSMYDAQLRQRHANAQLGEVGSIMVRDRRDAERSPPVP